MYIYNLSPPHIHTPYYYFARELEGGGEKLKNMMAGEKFKFTKCRCAVFDNGLYTMWSWMWPSSQVPHSWISALCLWHSVICTRWVNQIDASAQDYFASSLLKSLLLAGCVTQTGRVYDLHMGDPRFNLWHLHVRLGMIPAPKLGELLLICVRQ